MGGDDLGSDDEDYLNITDLSPSSYHSDEEEKKGSASNPEAATTSSATKKSKKKKGKKRKRGDSGNDDDNDEDEGNKKVNTGGDGGSGSKKEEVTSKNLLLVAGRDIASQSSEAQAAFLNACASHHLRMERPRRDDDNDDNEDENSDDENDKLPTFKPENFYKPGKGKELQQQQHQSMATFLKSGPLTSFKKLKKWKNNQSPMVLVVCVSARRAVAVLKQLASLNIRCAKLFAKHMDVKEQRELLLSNSYGIAVGTPNRLLKLLEQGESGGGRLSLEHTELLVIDGHEDRKRYTVCTLNDTAPDLASFFQKAVCPELTKRDSIKIAMF